MKLARLEFFSVQLNESDHEKLKNKQTKNPKTKKKTFKNQ